MSASNTWPDGKRRPLTQSEHAAWNARYYPGTRQLCCFCESATGRCEEDSLLDEDGNGPFCVECWKAVRAAQFNIDTDILE